MYKVIYENKVEIEYGRFSEVANITTVAYEKVSTFWKFKKVSYIVKQYAPSSTMIQSPAYKRTLENEYQLAKCAIDMYKIKNSK